jgi:hypothetical protein
MIRRSSQLMLIDMSDMPSHDYAGPAAKATGQSSFGE